MGRKQQGYIGYQHKAFHEFNILDNYYTYDEFIRYLNSGI